MCESASGCYWDEYEEEGEVDKADTLTEALDALEDAYDAVNDVLLDD